MARSEALVKFVSAPDIPLASEGHIEEECVRHCSVMFCCSRSCASVCNPASNEGSEALLTGWSLVRIRPGEPSFSKTYV